MVMWKLKIVSFSDKLTIEIINKNFEGLPFFASKYNGIISPSLDEWNKKNWEYFLLVFTQ